MKGKKWQYGKDPNPSTWQHTSQIIKANSPKKVNRHGDQTKPTRSK